jgi:hypothetical protein
VIFSLTAAQAAALLSIKIGCRLRAESPAALQRLIDGLKRKALVIERAAGELALTENGADAAAICARMALNGRARPQL